MSETFIKLVKESPVGSIGRTTHADADDFIDNNPQIIEQFRRIVNSMGGKAVARRVLDRMGAKKSQDITETAVDVETVIREHKFKIKMSYPNQDGSKELEFYTETDRDDAYVYLIDTFGEIKSKIKKISLKSLLISK